jgi:hypothetical protein
MNIIKQNPFRILGLTGNATEKELQKQIGIIKRYAEVGKTKSFDYDFEFIGDFTRNSDEIQQASNSIEQAHKKLLYSLFWFVKNNQFDEIAFNNLKEKETDKAIEIWNKTLKEEITSKNYSSYLNLSTLYIALSTIDDQIELQKLQAGISLKGNLIHSENLKDFSKLVTGNGIANDPIEISKRFVDEVLELLKPYLNKTNGISTNDLISLFNTFPASIKKYISAKFTEIPISSIENKIEKTTRKRKDNPRNAEENGEELYKSTKSDITLLKKLMGASNVQFQMLSDKVANEILQCSVDFFNDRQENDSENNFETNLNTAIELVKLAKSVAVSSQVKDRANENIETLNGMRDREVNQAIALLSSIKLAYEKAISEIDAQVVAMSMRLSYNQTVNYSKVDKMKANCLDWSKVVEVVSNGISMNNIATIQRCSNQIKVSEYKSLVDFLFSKLGPIQINQVKHICYWKDVRATQAKATAKKVGSTISSATDSGCYIATMAYGDYDHPQVMILRKFRDETLSNTFFGRSFVSFYYATSPHLVKLLKNQKYINQLIRNLLDRFVNKVK